MRKIKSYIAISIDGKIAKSNGDIAWLEDIPNPNNDDYGYPDFFNSIDTTLMGRKTYDQIIGFDVPFPYSDKTNYVFTTEQISPAHESVEIINENPVQFIQTLKSKSGKDIWLIGGAILNSTVLNANLIDEYFICVLPIIIGQGIPLFVSSELNHHLNLISTKTYESGAIMLHYLKK